MPQFKIKPADHQIISGLEDPDSPTKGKCGVCYQPIAWFEEFGWCHVEAEPVREIVRDHEMSNEG